MRFLWDVRLTRVAAMVAPLPWRSGQPGAGVLADWGTRRRRYPHAFEETHQRREGGAARIERFPPLYLLRS